MALTTRAVLASYHVHLDNGDIGFRPYTHLIIRLEVLDGIDAISSSNQSSVIFHDGDVQKQLSEIDATTIRAGFPVMAQTEKDKLTDQLASIAKNKGQLNI